MTNPFGWDDPRWERVEPAHRRITNHASLCGRVDALADAAAGGLRVEEIGRSYEGRAIRMASIGTGETSILLWTQMHGDEWTHTWALLDILALLTGSSDDEDVQTLLLACTLHCVLMLNPDGAEMDVRRNAQGIDINRDARRLASPEGTVLLGLVKRLRPRFGFNLHNQNRLTSVGTPAVPAAVSLLVPPLDESGSETESVLRAKRVASYFLGRVRGRCKGMVSRYDADFMPRCFGENIQGLGVSTVLVEAGGWAEDDDSALTHLHRSGLLQTLHGIAVGAYEDAPVEDYEQLPRSNEHRLFDLLIRQATVVPGKGRGAFRADLGLNREENTGGRLADIGDLGVTTGWVVIEADGMRCVPARWVVDPSFRPGMTPTAERCEDLLRAGVGSLIGLCDVADEGEVASLCAVPADTDRPVSIGWIADCRRLPRADAASGVQGFLASIAAGALGVLAQGDGSEAASWSKVLGVPLCPSSWADTGVALEAGDGQAIGPRALEIDAPADLLVLEEQVSDSSPIGGDLKCVIVGGIVVWERGRVVDGRGGRILGRRLRPVCSAPAIR